MEPSDAQKFVPSSSWRLWLADTVLTCARAHNKFGLSPCNCTATSKRSRFQGARWECMSGAVFVEHLLQWLAAHQGSVDS